MVVGFGVHADKALGIGYTTRIAKGTIAGLDPFACIRATIPLAYHAVERRQLLLNHISNIDKEIKEIEKLCEQDSYT